MGKYEKHDAELLLSFGSRMRARRLEKGLSQEDLAEITDLHRNYIGSAERGERNISLINIYKIANALEISVCELISTKK